jgi:predicted signal transduction protein with EAL and GGDEF domain
MLDGHAVRMSASMGCCAFPLRPEATGDWALCLRAADAALYRAKLLGRDRRAGFAAGTSVAHGSRRDIAELEAQGVLVQVEGASKEPGSFNQRHPEGQ